MCASEHSVETSAAPEQIWRLRADVAGWPEWNGDIERIELIGTFTAVSTIVMTPIGEGSFELRIAEAVEHELFVDETEIGEIVVRAIHRIRRSDPDTSHGHSDRSGCRGSRAARIDSREAVSSRRRLHRGQDARTATVGGGRRGPEPSEIDVTRTFSGDIEGEEGGQLAQGVLQGRSASFVGIEG
jgi:hypothetical protein